MEKPDIKKVKQLLTEAPIGKYLGEYGIDVFAECASVELKLDDNELLFQQGDTDNTFYILKRGRVARFVKDEITGREKIIHIFERGDLIGELGFIAQQAHSTSVKALGEAVILCFKEEDIQPLIIKEPEVMYQFMKAVVTRVHHTLKDVSRQQMALSNYISGSPYR
ncbi:MAG: cyclic nucleotide-binding domain-containing protein [Sulfurovum sp.]|nr:cyclic nucleotide-binding domain-containing protein [Sulfurovum sp.]